MVTITQLTPDNWEEYKEIRLKALLDDPQAFGSTYEDESKFTDIQWQERPNNQHTVILLARDDTRTIGMVGIHWEEYEKLSHVAHIWGMFVDKDYRGQGIGRQLMEEIEKKAREKSITEKIKLEVVTNQSTALELYRKLGFREVGVQEKQMKQDGVYYDSYLMEKLI